MQSAAVRSETRHLPIVQGFSRYVIAPTGEVFNRNRGRRVQPTLAGGRWRIALVDDEGIQRTMGLARLVAAHFLDLPPDHEEMYYDVAHQDGDYKNVHVSNLQWVARWRRYANSDNYGHDIS